MTYRGKIQNGVVVLDKPSALAEGTEVTVQPVKPKPAGKKKGKREPTLYERMKEFVGVADDLPPDGSHNIDHYLYGAPKRK